MNLKKVTLRNFRSFGNIPYTFDINKYENVFLFGDNGAGKSTSLPHAIVYGLFNKTIEQKDKLSSLVNSMNRSECVVVVEFESKGKLIKVTRGMKPSIFDIEVDGVMLPKEAKKGEHQAILESYIGCTYSVFCNNIILTLAQFKPFISMSVGDRRETVEQFLDLTIFPLYVDKIKSDIKVKKLDQEELAKKATEAQYKKQASKQIIESLQEQLNNVNSTKEFYLDELKEKYDAIGPEFNEIEQQISLSNMMLSKYDGVDGEYDKIKKLIYDFESKISGIYSNISKFEKLDGVCYTCGAKIDEHVREQSIGKLGSDVKPLEKSLVTLKSMLTDVHDKIKKRDSLVDKINRFKFDIKELETKRVNLEKTIKKTTEELTQDSEPITNKILLETNTIKDCEELIMDLNNGINECENKISTCMEALDMFSDKGIKRSIIKKYIPILNQKVNEYLNAMGLYLNFNMDSKFNVEFNSPDRKGQTSNSLSSGQQRRVDLAVVLAWRHIANIKNSIKTNFLMLDEILNPLDISGHETVIKMFRECFPDIRLFVTSQHKEFKDLFNSSLKFSLVGGFTNVD